MKSRVRAVIERIEAEYADNEVTEAVDDQTEDEEVA